MKSWNSAKHPVFEADQMPVPVHWNPMNEDWKTRLTKSQIYNTSSGFDAQTLKAMKELHDKILTFGGDEVCMTQFDEDTPKILERGQFFYGSSYMRKGRLASAITIPHGYGMKTKTGVLLQRAMLFPKTDSGAAIPGSFNQCRAPFACGKPPLNVLLTLAWF